MNKQKYDVSLVNYSMPPFSNNDEPVLFAIPRGILLLAAVLDENGLSTQIMDYALTNFKNPMKEESFCEFIKDTADIIGISCSSNLFPILINSLKIYKKNHPHKCIVLGGANVAAVGQKIMSSFDFIDFVIEGEAEYTFVELVKAIAQGSDLDKVNGIIFRSSGSIVNKTIPKHRMEYLDLLPLPAYDLIDASKYNYPTIETSRGCHFSCTFCHFPASKGSKVYTRSIENVISEIKMVVDLFSPKMLKMIDDNFAFSKQRTLEFCNKYMAANIKVKYGIYTRINTIDEEVMKALSQSGCHWIFFGIESGSETILKKINKKLSLENVFEKLVRSKKYFDTVIASFIWNFPFEDFEEFMLTLRQIHKFRKHGISIIFSELMPFPASKLYNEYKNKISYNRSKDFVFERNYFTGTNYSEDAKTLIKKYPNIFSSFYVFSSPDEALKRKLYYLYLMYDRDMNYFKNVIIKVKNKYLIFDENLFIFGQLKNIELNNPKIETFETSDDIVLRLIFKKDNKIDSKESLTKLKKIFRILDSKNIKYHIINAIPDCISKYKIKNISNSCENCIVGTVIDLDKNRIFICKNKLVEKEKIETLVNELKFKVIYESIMEIESEACKFCFKNLRGKNILCNCIIK